MNFTINPPKSPIAFNVFDYQIHWYGIILMSAIVVGLFFSYFFIKQNISKKEADEFIDFSPILILFSIFGARVFYVIGSFDFYKNNLKEIIMINHGGISIWGAIIFGTVGLFLYLKKKKYQTNKYFDLISITLPLSQAIGRWGNYFNQEAWGKPASSFIKLYVDYKYRYEDYKQTSYYHPTFLYESVLDFLLFIVLVFVFYKYKNLKCGTIFCLYLILYGIIRIFVEHFRMDSIMYVDNFPIAQVISFIVIVIASYRLFYIYKKVPFKK